MKLCLIHLLCFVCLTSNIFPNVEKYLKKVENKSKKHKLKNIDYIYMINLDERPEKWEASSKSLKKYNIYPYRFSAVNGWHLTDNAINDVGVKFNRGMQGNFMGTRYPINYDQKPLHEKITKKGITYFCHCMSRGAIGIVLSHLSILKDALQSGYQTIWVMEDDIKIIRDPRLLSKIIENINKNIGMKNWDVLFTDRDTKNNKGEYVPCGSAARRPNFNPPYPNHYALKKRVGGFRRIGARYGAYSVIYNRSGMQKIYNFIKRHLIFLPYDMDFYLPPGIKMYTVTEDIVAHTQYALSDNGGPNYLKKKK